MTVTRTPCELDKMSLFQEMKLKRRKVDSRCSSDGESVADTSSPDFACCPPSPKLEHPVSPDLNQTDPSVFDGGGTPHQSVICRGIKRSHSPPPPPANAVNVINSPIHRQSPYLMIPESILNRSPPTSSPSLIQYNRPGVIRPPTSPPPTQFWNQNHRMNGTLMNSYQRAGGMKPPVQQQQQQVVRSTPTVIMGEVGGVRTMIWSQPPATSPVTDHASTSSCSSSNPEESAAQMLLTLGQDRIKRPLNMERLWAGDLTQLPPNQPLNLTSPGLLLQQPSPSSQGGMVVMQQQQQPSVDPADEEDQPMICMICEDKATGLHYGIITCEGCKGFFKRTVQNRRVYTCVADGNCEITKAQRNRCQYCRFKKCIEQGMVLQAVREDRMPGGRNSGAVYNLYKVKYKKHKKTTSQKQQQQHQQQPKLKMQQQQQPQQSQAPPEQQQQQQHGQILKTALTNPQHVVHLRHHQQQLQQQQHDIVNVTSSSSSQQQLQLIQTLIDCDEFEDIATLQNLDELLDNKLSDLSDKLCQIGDSIVYKLVQWTKRLPFYLELPVEVHTRLLTHKWHELLVLTTSAYQAIHGGRQHQKECGDFGEEVNGNLHILQTCLTSMMGRPITMEQLRQDVGLMVEKITHVTLMFRRIRLTMHEYVCLKVITMLNQGRSTSTAHTTSTNSELETIQERYAACLRALTQQQHPQQPQRFQELLIRLPEIQSAAALLLESKMFYVPFLLNSAIQR